MSDIRIIQDPDSADKHSHYIVYTSETGLSHVLKVTTADLKKLKKAIKNAIKQQQKEKGEEHGYNTRMG